MTTQPGQSTLAEGWGDVAGLEHYFVYGASLCGAETLREQIALSDPIPFGGETDEWGPDDCPSCIAAVKALQTARGL